MHSYDETEKRVEAAAAAARRREAVHTLAIGIGAVVAGGFMLFAIAHALGWL